MGINWDKVKHVSETGSNQSDPVSLPVSSTGIDWNNVRHLSEPSTQESIPRLSQLNRVTPEDQQQLAALQSQEPSTSGGFLDNAVDSIKPIAQKTLDNPVTNYLKWSAGTNIDTMGKIGNFGAKTLQTPQSLLLNTSKNITNALQGKPLEWKNNYNYRQYLQDINGRDVIGDIKNPFLRGVADSTGEIATDPLTFFAGGVADDLAKAGKLGVKALPNTTENLMLNAERGINASRGLRGQKNIPDIEVPVQEASQPMQAQSIRSLPETMAADVKTSVDLPKMEPLNKNVVRNEPVVPAGMKARKFAQTVANAPNTPDELKKLINEKPIAYNPISNEDTLNKARQLVDANTEEAKSLFSTVGKTVTADDVAVGETLINRAIQSGNYAEANRYTAELAEKLTEAGQAVQAASMFQRMTPEGLLMYANRTVNKINRNIEDQFGKLAKKVILTDEEAKVLVDRMINAQGITDDRKKAVEMARTMQVITNKIPTSIVDKTRALRNISLLGNAKTFTRNITGNVLMGVADNIANVVGTPIDMALSQFTKQRSVALPNLKIQASGAKRGLTEALSDSLGGLSREELAGKSIGERAKMIFEGAANPIDTAAVQNGKFEAGRNLSFKNKPMRVMENAVNTSLALGDRPFSQAYYDDVMNQLKKANKVTETTPEMIETAKKVAAERTYQDTNTISKGLDSIKNWPKHIEGPVKRRILQIAMDSVIPYAKTPAAVLKRGLELTPVGILEGLSKLGAGLATNNINLVKQREIVDRIARGVVGSALLLGGYTAYKNGFATGAANKDKDAAAFEKSLGKQSYSFKVGDKYYTFNWAQPVSMPIGAGVQMKAASKEGTDNVTALLDAGAEALNYYSDQPMLQSLQRLLGGGYNDKGLGQRLTAAGLELPKQFIPSLLRQSAQYTDTNQRETYSPNFFNQNLVNPVKSNIPGLRGTLPSKVDVFGNDVKQANNTLFNTFVNPGSGSEFKPNQIQKEILRIYENSGNKEQFPRVAPKSIQWTDPKTKKQQTIQFTPEEYAKYQQRLGQLTQQKFDNIINGNGYSSKSDVVKAKDLSNAITDANEQAKKDILKRRGLIK